MARQQKLIHLHGSTQLTKDKATAVNMATGELAMMNGTQETSELYVLTSDGNIATFVTGAKVAGDIATAKSGAETTAKDYADAAQSAAEATAKSYTDGVKTDLQGKIDALSDKVGATDVAAQIQAAVAAEESARKAADSAEESARKAADAALQEAVDDKVAQAAYDTKVGELEAADTANTTAINNEAARAKAAEAQALTDAKDYADGLNTTMGGRVDALEADTHTHANKALLDTYDQTNANIKDAVDKKHEHANKAELDKIADGDKAKWDAATNRINTFMDSEEIAGTVDTLHEINNWMTSAGANATDLSTAIANEKKAREDEDAAIRGEFAAADTTTLNSAKAYADQAEADALADAKAYTDAREVEIKKYADQAEADALAAAKTYADGLNTDMDARVDILEVKFGTGEGSVSDQIADAIAAEVTRSNKYTDDAIAAEVTRSNDYADQAEADALAAAKTYTNEVLGGNYTSTNTVTTAFTTAINNAIAGIDLEKTGTGANTGIDVTVKIEDGKTMTVAVDDSNLVIDCGTY